VEEDMTDHAVPESDSASPALLPAVVAADELAAEDPQGDLRMALAGGLDPAIPPEDMVLSWLLRLPDGIDPATAARHVIATAGTATPGAEALRTLLVEVARWPAPRLAHLGRQDGRAAACPGPC
jgi:hypothetical protein